MDIYVGGSHEKQVGGIGLEEEWQHLLTDEA